MNQINIDDIKEMINLKQFSAKFFDKLEDIEDPSIEYLYITPHRYIDEESGEVVTKGYDSYIYIDGKFEIVEEYDESLEEDFIPTEDEEEVNSNEQGNVDQEGE